MLYVIATPIGNLSDVSQRLRDTLIDVDVLFCEDTRQTRKLFSALALTPVPQLEALHAHNEEKRLHFIEQLWESNKIVGLVCDAGTPTVSDPGRFVVQHAHLLGVDVRTIAGPSSITSALSVSGFPVAPFIFLGFPPRKPGPRKQWLIKASQQESTMVILESGKRFPALLRSLKEICPERELCICRELTKAYEEVTRSFISECPEEPLRGECVIIVGPGKAFVEEHSKAAGLKGVAQELATLWGISKREAYNLLISFKPNKPDL